MMDEYTPTTAEIRGIYVVFGFDGNRSPKSQHQSVYAWGAEFDRWLKTVKNEVREELKEQIMAIIDDDRYQEHEGLSWTGVDRIVEILGGEPDVPS